MSEFLPYSMYYENSAGEILYLDRLPFVTTSCRLFDSSWKLTRAQRPLGEGGGLLSRKRPAEERTLTVRAAAPDAAALSAELARMADIFDYDVSNSTSGKLWVNGSYMRCWCSGRAKQISCDIVNQMQITVTVCPEQPTWCTERHYRLAAGNASADESGHNYPYRYPYRYGTTRQSVAVYNSHFSPAPMIITLYGPALEPRVYIAGNCIGVNSPLMSGERVIIDQQKRLVTKTCLDGSQENCFGDRIKNGQTFLYAPSGYNVVDLYNDTLGVDIVLIEQRSEPAWSCG